MAARSAAGPAVDHEALGMLRNLGIEVVEEHPQRRLGIPAERVERRPARRPHGTQVAAQLLDERLTHARAPTCDSAASRIDPPRIAAATRSMSALSDRSSVNRGESSRTASWTARTPSPGWSGARNSMA